jgi:hypothetical protein
MNELNENESLIQVLPEELLEKVFSFTSQYRYEKNLITIYLYL